jgi:hypothetical protein
MKRFRIFIVISLLAVEPAMAAGIVLTKEKFTSSENTATQLLTARNNGPPLLDLVVECGFFQGSTLLTTARQIAMNVDTEQTVDIEVTANNAAGADHADCRISGALPK